MLGRIADDVCSLAALYHGSRLRTGIFQQGRLDVIIPLSTSSFKHL